MKKEKATDVKAGGEQDSPHRVRLPGFILDEDVGLGSVIKKVTATFGVRPCGGCEQRAQALNRRLVFTSKRSK
jgi:hypothetical protein